MRVTDCIFCKIANNEIPSETIYEDDCFRAILDLSPASRGHALILSKKHFKDLTEIDEEVSKGTLMLAGRIGTAMVKALHCTGFNLVQNNGASAGQTVFHFHMHVIPQYDDGIRIANWVPQTIDGETMKQIAESIKTVI